ncbi:MAG: DUF1641 domain-containing protein [Rhodanobacter sp.]
MNTHVADTRLASQQSFDSFLQDNPQLNDPATLRGMADLIEKLAPLLQGRRFHNLIDLLSAVSDVVDMTDDAMVQKMMKGYENVMAGAFNLSNLTRYANAQAGAEENPPTVWQSLRRLNGDADARRGLAMGLAMLGQLGRQARQDGVTLPDD